MAGGSTTFGEPGSTRGEPLRAMLAGAVRGLHLSIVAILCVGWLTPWPVALWTVVFLAPAVQVGWWLNRDRCVLTELEERLRGPRQRMTLPEDAERSPNFIVDLLSAALRRPVSHDVTNRLIYAVNWLGFSVALMRLTIS